jgi:thiol:disulfide interchange protein DsbA
MNKFLGALALVLPLLLNTAPAAAITPGVDYLELTPPQPTDAKRGQIEVVEFFWYRCPHCFHLEPDLNAWIRKQPRDVVISRVPATLNESWVPLARAYYALDALGLEPRLHDALFDAIHVRGMDLNPPGAFLDWAVTKGVDRRKLANAYNSFGVNSKVMRAQQMTKDYNITGVPAFAVNGKYVTSAYMAGGEKQLFAVLDQLIAKERKPRHRRR